MKRLATLLLAICLATCIVLPAHAQNGPITVRSVGGLQNAIAFAEDGDVIAITKPLILNGVNLSTEKDVTITRTFLGQTALQCFNCTFKGLNFADSFSTDWFFLICQGTTIENCGFSFAGHKKEAICIIDGVQNVDIRDCTFDGNVGSFILSGENAAVLIESSTFIGAEGSAINNHGIMSLRNCTIQGNSCENTYGICNSGTINIENSIIKDNLGIGDVFSAGIINFSYDETSNFWFYDIETGQKSNSSIVGSDCEGGAKLICLTEEEAIERFGPPETHPGDDGDDSNAPKDPSDDVEGGETIDPAEPADQPGSGAEGGDVGEKDDSETTIDPVNPNNPPDDSDPPQKPIEGSNPPEDQDVSTEQPQNPSETTDPSEPAEPPANPTDDEEAAEPEKPEEPEKEPTVRPQKPIIGDDGDKDEYTLPVIHKPVGGTVKPVQSEDNQENDEEQQNKRSLICGDAVIDCSRSAVLYGYGDGLLHKDDPLTRAQMATIIFRLLDEESTAKLSTPLSSFVDVSADAWCAPYVLPLADAGVVNGTGGGYYSPNNLATWGQFFTVLGRFVEPQECILWNIQYDGWARQAVETAVALGWIEDSAAVNPNAVITRGEAVALINTVLEMNR